MLTVYGSSSGISPGSAGTRLQVYASEKPAPARTSSTQPAQALLPRELDGRGVACRQRRRHLLDPEAHHLLDEVDRPGHVERAPRRHRHLVAVELEAEPGQRLALLGLRERHSAQPVGELGPQPHDRTLRQRSLDVDVACQARAGERDDQLARVDRGLLGRVGVDALLEARRRLAAEPEAPGGAQHGEGFEVRRLEQQVGRLVAHLAVLAAHDPGDRDRPARVGDDEIRRSELPLVAVEGDDLLSLGGAADDDPLLGEQRDVEEVQRRAEREHDVVRRVDDVRDRPHAGGQQPRLQPGRARLDARAAKDPADVARAGLEILDANVHLLVAVARRIGSRRRRQLGARQRGDFARDPVDGREIRPVEAGLDLEHGLGEREHVGERRSRLELVREHHDPAVVGAELELALGQDHPARELAAQLRLPERLVRPGQERARERDGDRRPGAEVPGAADDLARLALADVDAAELQPVRVRVLAGLDDAADEEAAEVAVGVGDAAVDDPVDLAAREDELRRQPLERPVEGDVLAQPGDREPSAQNCLDHAEVVLPEEAQVGEAVAEERDPVDPEPEGEPRPLLGVVADRLEDVRVDDARRRPSRSSPSACRRGSRRRRRGSR